MPVNTRDLWLFLKAQDQTNRALNAFSRNVRNAGNSVRMAQLEAERASAAAAIQQSRLIAQSIRSENAQMSAQKAALRYTAAQMQASGATEAQVNAVKKHAEVLDHQIIRNKNTIAGIDAQIVALNRQKIAIEDQIRIHRLNNEQIAQSEKNLKHMAGSMQAVSQSATAMGFAMAAGGGVMLIGLHNAIQTSIEYEKQVRATATQVDGFRANLEELAEVGRRVAREIAVPFKDIQPALFDIFSSMEVGIEDAERLLKSFSKAAVAGGVEIQDVSRATIGLLNAFQRPASDVNKLLDIQFQLIQEGIGTYEEWNQRIGLVTPSAVRAGQSIEIMMAALATATRMGMSAARSGTSVARAFDALSHPKTISNLKALGVNMLDANGKMRPFNESLRDFREALNKLPESKRLETILDVFKGAGGTIEARRFLQNILLGKGQLELFDMVLKETSNSAGSLENAYKIMADGAAAKTQMLNNQWMLLKEGVGTALTPAFIVVVETVTRLIDRFNQLDPSVKRNIAIIAALAAVFSILAGGFLLVLGIISAFAAAFAVAGTAILATTGILLAVVAAITAVGAAFVLAYKNSEEFRVLLGQVVQYIRMIKDVAVEFGEEIVRLFNEHVKVELEILAEFFEKELLPAFTTFSNFVASEFVKSMKEASEIVADLVGKGFKILGTFINEVLNPALAKAVEWWQNNKQHIEPLIPIIMEVVKWIAIVAAILVGVLVAAIAGPVIATIAALVAAIGTIIFIVAKVVQFFQMLWDKLNEFVDWADTAFISLWENIKDAVGDFLNWISGIFGSVWDGIVDAAKAFWQMLVDAFNASMEFIKGLWERFWNSTIGGLVQAVIGLVLAIVDLLWTTLKIFFQTGVDALKETWSLFWNFIKDFIIPIWEGIKETIARAWETIWGFFKSWGNSIKEVAALVWNTIRDKISEVWNSIMTVVTSFGGKVRDGLSATWNAIRSRASEAFNTIKSTISDKLNDAADFVTGWRDRITGFFKGAGSWLFNSGKEIISGLIEGLTSKINALKDKINQITGIIKDHFPGSPVKVGPLRVLNHGYVGKQIVKMIADGIAANTGMLNSQMAFSTAGMIDDFAGFQPTFVRDQGAASNVKTINNYITVNTNEIDPRIQSERLGWELGGLM